MLVKFFLGWAVIIFFSSQQIFADTQPNHHLMALAEYQNLSKNFGELLDEMEAFGGVSRTERSEIEGFLKTKSISLDTPITKVSLEGDTLIYGSQRLTLLSDGSFKTKNGRIIRGSKGEARDVTFKKTFSAIVEKEYSLRFPFSILIEEAEAGQFADFVEAATAAIGRTIWTGFSAVAVPICGAVGVPLDGFLWWSKKLIFEGTIKCVDGRYTMTHYDEFWKQFKTDYDDALRRLGGQTSWWAATDKAGVSVCFGPFARAMGEEPFLPEARIKKDEVPYGSLKEAFPDKSVPPCNTENARVAENFMKKKLAVLKKSAEDVAQRTRFGASSAPQQSDFEKGVR